MFKGINPIIGTALQFGPASTSMHLMTGVNPSKVPKGAWDVPAGDRNGVKVATITINQAAKTDSIRPAGLPA